MPDSSEAVLLFDLGGVLIENHMFSELKRLMTTERTEAELIDVWLQNPVARRFELGGCSAEQFARSVVVDLGLDLPPAEFLAAFKQWPKGFYGGVEPMLRQLRRNHTVACLSNSNEAHWTDSITARFDFAFSSHLIGCIKPERSAFHHALNAIGVRASAVHFFDDAAVNVDAARSCGLNAFRTVGYDDLRSTLIELVFLP